MIKIGLTGGIACGKSKALHYFENLGAHTIDADRLARKVVKPGEPALEEIEKHFGKRVILENGSLNRQVLADLIFSDPTARNELNHIVHPHIIKEESKQLAELELLDTGDEPCFVMIDASLMIEVGTYKRYDVILVIYCSRKIQLQRLLARNDLTEEQALNRIGSQLPILQKVQYADYVINTSGPVEETRGQIRFIYDELLIRCREGSLGLLNGEH